MRSKDPPLRELFFVRTVAVYSYFPERVSEAAMERMDAIVALDRKLGGLIEPDLEPATTFEPE